MLFEIIAGNLSECFYCFIVFLAALWLIKPGELSILELRQPGAWLPVRMDEMLTFEKWKE